MKKLSVTFLFTLLNFFQMYVTAQCGNPFAGGSSNNVYTKTDNSSNPVAVDKDLNTIVFVHRSNSVSFGGSSGDFRYDISTNGGTSWISDVGVLNPLGTKAGRYPNAVIYNPSGNTNPSNAYLGYWGPTVNTTTYLWDAPVTGVRKLNGTGNTETYNQNFNSMFLVSGSLVKGSPGVFWSIEPITANGQNLNGTINIYKGVWNANNDISWSINNTITMPVALANGIPHIGDCNIAFDPTGTLGWCCAITDLTSGPAIKSFYPVFYKTVNGGTTWTGPISVDMSSMSCITSNINLNSVPATEYSADMAVDVSGNPHLFTTVGNGSNTYSYTLNYNQWHNMFDITQKNGVWAAYDVAPVNAGTITYTGSSNGVITMNLSPQVARSADGTKVFFSWLNNSLYSLGNTNTIPNLFARGLDVQQSKWTPTKDFSSCNTLTDGKILFPHLAEEVLEPASGVFKLAPVYAEFSIPGNPDQTNSFKFLDNCSFNNSDFTVSQPVAPISIVQGSSLLLCPGSTLNLQASGTFSQIAWTGGYTTTASPVSTPGKHYVTIQSGCNFGIDSISVVNLTMTSVPLNPLICRGENGTISVIGNAYSYTWAEGPTVGTSIVVSPTTTSGFIVTATGDQNCTYDLVVNMAVSACSGIQPNNMDEEFLMIYPNPNNGIVKIKSVRDVSIKLINELGECLKTIFLNEENEYELSLNNLSKGIYFIVSGENNNKSVARKIVVE